jgi:hypothetical protein
MILKPDVPETASESQVSAPDHPPSDPPADTARALGGHGASSVTAEYVKLNNQFVVPVLNNGKVRSMVVISLTVEAPQGSREQIYAREPRIRDEFLQVMFDHANAGGFDGVFTTSANLDALRTALREAGTHMLGNIVRDILVTDIARQDL